MYLQLLLFDVRFGKIPLRKFHGHINNYLSSLVGRAISRQRLH